MTARRSGTRAVLLGVILLLASAPPGGPHELPTFPRVRLLAATPHPWQPATRILTVKVRDPSGQTPVANAEVFVAGLERARGSAVRLREHWLAPTPQPGVYQGAVEFPGPGVWDLTVTVKGRYIGEAHFELDIAGRAPRAASRGGQPELAFGWPGWRLLLLDWGHLLGFGLWLGVTALALAQPQLPPRATALLTWLALAIGIATGFNKMEYGTPFPRGLTLFSTDAPRIFFGREYVSTLFVKHVLIVVGVLVTALLTREVVWAKQESDGRPRTARLRLLFLANLLIVLAIGAAAAVLGLLHAIVLHFG